MLVYFAPLLSSLACVHAHTRSSSSSLLTRPSFLLSSSGHASPLSFLSHAISDVSQGSSDEDSEEEEDFSYVQFGSRYTTAWCGPYLRMRECSLKGFCICSGLKMPITNSPHVCSIRNLLFISQVWHLFGAISRSCHKNLTVLVIVLIVPNLFFLFFQFTGGLMR